MPLFFTDYMKNSQIIHMCYLKPLDFYKYTHTLPFIFLGNCNIFFNTKYILIKL